MVSARMLHKQVVQGRSIDLAFEFKVMVMITEPDARSSRFKSDLAEIIGVAFDIVERSPFAFERSPRHDHVFESCCVVRVDRFAPPSHIGFVVAAQFVSEVCACCFHSQIIDHLLKLSRFQSVNFSVVIRRCFQIVIAHLCDGFECFADSGIFDHVTQRVELQTDIFG